MKKIPLFDIPHFDKMKVVSNLWCNYPYEFLNFKMVSYIPSKLSLTNYVNN